MSIIVIGFTAFLITEIVIYSVTDKLNRVLIGDIFAYGFLLCFFLMAAANVVLLLAVKAHDKLNG